MKTLIVAINSKYIHSALSVWYLKASCDIYCGEVVVREFTINQRHADIFFAVYREKADNIALSCYIWNIRQVLDLIKDIKKAAPETRIILGGPEVSFDCGNIMRENPSIDYIIRGEGEDVFKKLLMDIKRSEMGIIGQDIHNMSKIRGLCYRNGEKIIAGKQYNIVEKLDTIKSPYTDDMLHNMMDKTVYFESSRGCPFSCTYCLSSAYEGVRYFSLERVKDDLHTIIKKGVKQVKFLDRTFNCDKNRAREIIKFILEYGNDMNFHFEICADLVDDEMAGLLKMAPDGLIQLEIGIQSLNTRSLESVNRKSNIEKLFHNVRNLMEFGNIHIHLDLIAGLPYEGLELFKNSFNGVFELRPHYLQLGFLKLLKGTLIRYKSDEHGYIYSELPPYEIISNSYISFDEILILKYIEKVFNMYYNSSAFIKSLDYAIYKYGGTPFDFFRELYDFLNINSYFVRMIQLKEKYTVLKIFFKSIFSGKDMNILNELLKFDYFSSGASKSLPKEIERPVVHGIDNMRFDFLNNKKNVEQYLPGLYGIPVKQIIKKIHIEIFEFDVKADKKEYSDTSANNYKKTLVLFNHTEKNPVTGLYNSFSFKYPTDLY